MHGLEVRGAAVRRGRFHEPGRFGRMLAHLRSLTEFEPGAKELGKAGGPMDGGAPREVPPEATNPRIRAGFTFLGQFIDHDITFDPTSSLERQNDPEAIKNFRTPVLELDSVYGSGPGAQPYLYDPDQPGAFAIARLSDGDGNSWDDLPRAEGSKDPEQKGPRQTAIIGDPRNDENLIVSQLHLAFMKFHNAVLAADEVQALPPSARFEEAQRIVRWHYQWMILDEFLPLTCGEDVVDDVRRNGRRFFHFEQEPFMPVEFSVAAYRFGHSQVRPGYALGAGGGPIFGAPGSDLRGNRKLPRNFEIDWSRFFGEAEEVQFGMRIDTKLVTPLLDLPDTVVPRQPKVDPVTNQPVLNVETGAEIDVAERSLAVRNLQRGLAFRLPSGQAAARYMASVGIEPLSEEDIWEGVPGGRGPAPLWFYILREAEKRGRGEHLHGVGARIVAEVLIGLIEGDLASFLNHDPAWKPYLGQYGRFGMTDLLQYAGVMPRKAPAAG